MMTVTIPVQPLFGYILTIAQPLVPIEAAAFILDLESKEVLRKIDDGKLEYAWDIRNPACRRKSEVRVYWRCVLAMLKGEPVVLKEAEVYADIIPPGWPQVRASALYRRWACSQWLVARLIERKLLAIAGPKMSRGPDSSPEVPRESAVEFLKSRRMGADVTCEGELIPCDRVGQRIADTERPAAHSKKMSSRRRSATARMHGRRPHVKQPHTTPAQQKISANKKQPTKGKK